MVSIIAAMDQNRLIGRDNGLPWKLSKDLQNFKKLTTGQAIIMGRKTWDSLGRPLPNRKNIVISRNKDFAPEGCTVCANVEDAIKAAGDLDAFIIGGGQIYELTLPSVNEMILTEVATSAKGDAWFPNFNREEWTLKSREEHEADEKNEHNFSFCHYVRKESL